MALYQGEAGLVLLDLVDYCLLYVGTEVEDEELVLGGNSDHFWESAEEAHVIAQLVDLEADYLWLKGRVATLKT